MLVKGATDIHSTGTIKEYTSNKKCIQPEKYKGTTLIRLCIHTQKAQPTAVSGVQ